MIGKSTFNRISTGIDGLDTLLHGGLIPERGYMIRGKPGTGKTILGFHYLTTGVSNGETALFINLEEDEGDIRRNADTLGFDLDGIHFLDLSPSAEVFSQDQSYDIFDPSEVEGASFVQEIAERIDELAPDRVFVDPLTQLRYVTPDDYQFRKQVTGFMRFLKVQGSTVLFTTQTTDTVSDVDLQFLSHGVIELQRDATGRTVRVPKFRGSDMKSGVHALRITGDGIRVYPTIVPDTHSREFTTETVSAGIPEVDELLHGGVERGTVTVISGPTGVGKTSLGTQFMKEAAGRGEHSVIYLFEESQTTFLDRSEAINTPITQMLGQDSLTVESIEPLVRSTDEFAQMVRREVEQHDARIVMLDGIQGYRLSVQGDDKVELIRALHALGRYLKNMGVTVLFIDESDSITGEFQATNRNVSYIADNIVFLRYLEFQGELRKAIGVLKKRTSDFERTLREFEITEHGIKVGEPLGNLHGVLGGTPEIVDSAQEPSDTMDGMR